MIDIYPADRFFDGQASADLYLIISGLRLIKVDQIIEYLVYILLDRVQFHLPGVTHEVVKRLTESVGLAGKGLELTQLPAELLFRGIDGIKVEAILKAAILEHIINILMQQLQINLNDRERITYLMGQIAREIAQMGHLLGLFEPLGELLPRLLEPPDIAAGITYPGSKPRQQANDYQYYNI